MATPTAMTIRERVWTDHETIGTFDTFLYEPRHTEERHLGSLVIVGALLQEEPINEEAFILNAIAALARRSFYNPPRDADALEALEYTLRQVNTFLGEQAEQGELNWFGNLHIIIGCVHDNHVHIARAGNPRAILVRDNKTQDVTAMLTPSERTGETPPFKVFSAIASGTLERNDILLLCAPPHPLEAMPVAIDIEDQHNVFDWFHEQRDPASYACIAVDARPQQQETTVSFVDQLEKEFSEEPLTPAEPLSLDNIVADANEAPQPTEQQATAEQTPPPAQPASSAQEQHKKPPAPTRAPLPSRMTAALTLFGKRFLDALSHRIQKHTPSLPRPRRVRINIPYPLHIAGFGGLIGITLLITAIATTPGGEPHGVTMKQQTASIAASTIHQITPERIADVAPNPFSFMPAGIVPLGNSGEQILYSNNSGSLYRISDNGELQFVLFAANDGFRAGTHHDNAALLYTHTGALLSYGGPAQQYALPTASFAPERIRDIATFGNAVYLLRDDGAVIKYTPGDESYRETVWAAQTVPDPLSFAIDGSIYILDRSGLVREYRNGTHVRTLQTGVSNDEGLNIHTTNESPFLFIPVPAQQAIMLVNKETGDTTELHLTTPVTMTATALTPDAKHLFFLADTTLYQLPLSQQY